MWLIGQFIKSNPSNILICVPIYSVTYLTSVSLELITMHHIDTV